MKTSTAIRRGAAAVVMGGVAVGAFAVPANAAPSLDAIKQCESGGNYQAVNASSGASGAYQFLTSTWQGMGSITAGYATAADAPASVQDAAAAALMARSGASQWECSSMIASGAAASVSTQSSSV
ncbi:transglycosylase family protein [Kocuria sp.]|uniref:transglycosylase family protein n=1 Tax=Kocuria sp. TaxID=1871328 RepID=UPI0026DADFBA|nr:transglycosylase family protein [Kocuria sp.]MDO4920008.1 transglycosylase family protein [Kocuria sp.]